MRQMKQPRKDALREQLALAADEIIRLRVEIDRLAGKNQRLVAAFRAPFEVQSMMYHDMTRPRLTEQQQASRERGWLPWVKQALRRLA